MGSQFSRDTRATSENHSAMALGEHAWSRALACIAAVFDSPAATRCSTSFRMARRRWARNFVVAVWRSYQAHISPSGWHVSFAVLSAAAVGLRWAVKTSCAGTGNRLAWYSRPLPRDLRARASGAPSSVRRAAHPSEAAQLRTCRAQAGKLGRRIAAISAAVNHQVRAADATALLVAVQVVCPSLDRMAFAAKVGQQETCFVGSNLLGQPADEV